MKIYLAARYSRREELNGYRKQLESVGHVVTSTWLNGTHTQIHEGQSLRGADERARFALEDLADIKKSDWVISFTEAPDAKSSRGGRHVEFGLARAFSKMCTVVGYRENVFHHLPGVILFDTFEGCFEMSKTMVKE